MNEQKNENDTCQGRENQTKNMHAQAHMGTHTIFFLLLILFLCTCVSDSVRACRGGYFEMLNFLAGISE